MAMMTPWTPSRGQVHDLDPRGLCQYASRENEICWEVAAGVWYKALGTLWVCRHHHDVLEGERAARVADGAVPSLSTRWAPDGGERQGQDER